MKFDTLEYNGIERTFDRWGFGADSVESIKRNQVEDIFQATIVSSTVSVEGTTPTFPFEARVICRTNRDSVGGADNSFSGGTVKFVGKRVDAPMNAGPGGHGVTYRFRGPWYDLSETDFMQVWKSAAGAVNLPETVLFTSTAVPSASGQINCSVGDQLQAIFQWLLDQYAAQGMAAPFQLKGRDLTAGAIDLTFSGPSGGTITENTNIFGQPYNNSVNAATTIERSLFKLFLSTYIAKPMKCSQAILKCLEMSPRTNVWFDYTTVDGAGNPLPTVYVTTVDSMAAASLALFDGTNHKSLAITRRDDLIPRAVVVTYRITSSIGGATVVDYVPDKWGPGGSNNPSDPSTGLRVVTEMVDLSGGSVTFSTAHLDSEALACVGGTRSSRRSWWAARRGGEQAKLLDSRVRFQDKAGVSADLPDAVITYASTGGTDSAGNPRVAGQPLSTQDLALFTSRIVRGTAHAWMKVGSTPVQSLKVRVTSRTKFCEYDVPATGDAIDQPPADDTASNAATNGNRLAARNQIDLHANLEVTNGTTGEYKTVASSTAGEAYAVGATGTAAYLFNHMIVPQYDGQFVKVEANFVDASDASYLHPGKALNLTGGADAWATMRAQIQEVREKWAKKETSVRFGVAAQLNAGKLSSLLNMFRFRRQWFNPLLRSDNSQANGGQVDLPISAGGANSVEGLADKGPEVNTDWQTPPVGTTPGVKNAVINHDPTIITALVAGKTPTGGFSASDIKTMQPREVICCDASGDVVKAVIHATGFYEA